MHNFCGIFIVVVLETTLVAVGWDASEVEAA
jgi:hypothetical protein